MPRRHRQQDGFTLIEILVGLAISSLIMIGITLAMRTINTGFDSATESLERQGTLSTGLFIAGGDISRIARVVDDPVRPSQFLFSGGARGMSFVLAERPGANSSGLYWVRLEVRPGKDGDELVRLRAPFTSRKVDPVGLDWGDAVVLLRGNVTIAFSYRAPRLDLRQWAGSWQARNVLPQEVKIEITDRATGRLRVPVFVAALKMDAEADCVAIDSPGCTVSSLGQITGQQGK